MPAPVIWTTAPRIKFSEVQQLLLNLGFRRVPVTKPFIGLCDEESDASFVFSPYRHNSWFAPHHLAEVRVMLDDKGLMEADDFNRLVAEVAARHSAPH